MPTREREISTRISPRSNRESLRDLGDLENLAQSSINPSNRSYVRRGSDAGRRRIPVSHLAVSQLNRFKETSGAHGFKNDTREFARHAVTIAVVVDIRMRGSDKVIMIAEEIPYREKKLYYLSP